MTRFFPFRRKPVRAVHFNCLAGVISASAGLVLLLTFHATPVGAGLEVAQMDPVPSLTPQKIASRSSETSQGGLPATEQVSPEEISQRVEGAILGSRLALQLHMTLLELGKQRIEKFPDYTATFIKQERPDGDDLQEVQTLSIKMRHKPFSIYMKWLEGGDVGREVIYVDGLNDNKMLVHVGGLKGRLLPHLKLDPTGSLAMAEARHPIGELGLLHLTDLLISYRKRDMGLKSGVRWEMIKEQKFQDRECYCFVVEYDSREIEPVYRKSITYIDKELAIPICVRNFGWAEPDSELTGQELDVATLIEYYGYSDIRFDRRLGDADFDKTNEEYTFRR